MRIAVVDCETTGLDEEDEPISVGLVVAELDEVGRGLPRCRIYQEREPSTAMGLQAELIHGISATSLVGKSFKNDALLQVLQGITCVIAHNARFDARMLAKVIPEALSWSWRCSLRQRIFFELQCPSLQTICEHFDIARPNCHNALIDAEALLVALNHRPGKTARSKTYLQRIITSNTWPVFATQNPMLALDSTDGIVFSSISEKLLLEVLPGTPIRLWTNPEIDFVVGYARINSYVGGQGELFRFRKAENLHVWMHTIDAGEYVVESFNGTKVLIAPSTSLPHSGPP